MSDTRHEYADIPGTTVFDAQRSRQGYWLNQFCMSLMKADNRAAFKADEAGYLARFPMTDAQKKSILDRDWNRMIELGGNIYYTSKLAACDGLSFQQIAAIMTGSTQDDYARMMLDGGRPEVPARRLLEQLRRASVVVAPAAHLVERLQRLGLTRVALVPNAVDLERFRPGPRSDELTRDPGTPGHFEYFTGLDPRGAPRWSPTAADANPVFVDANVASGVSAPASVVYDAPLGRYLLVAWHGSATGEVGFFEAPNPWGPWSTLAYYDDWGGFNETAGEATGLSLPTKWISAEGRMLWIIFSGVNNGADNEYDSLNLVRVALQ